MVKDIFWGEEISIHALCEEGDPGRSSSPCSRSISIHALCEEGDVVCCVCGPIEGLFLSTPSARRATGTYNIEVDTREFLSTPSARRATSTPSPKGGVCYISIHALCEEGDANLGEQAILKKISIHALCEEGDLGIYQEKQTGAISIHALCEEGDFKTS